MSRIECTKLYVSFEEYKKDKGRQYVIVKAYKPDKLVALTRDTWFKDDYYIFSKTQDKAIYMREGCYVESIKSNSSLIKVKFLSHTYNNRDFK